MRFQASKSKNSKADDVRTSKADHSKAIREPTSADKVQ
jgi:hypothetical protein